MTTHDILDKINFLFSLDILGIEFDKAFTVIAVKHMVSDNKEVRDILEHLLNLCWHTVSIEGYGG